MAFEDSNLLAATAHHDAAPVAASVSLPPIDPAPDDKTVISKRPPLPLEALSAAPLLPNPGASLAGSRLEHYELNDFVGGGGMGAVYRAADTRLGRTVAVKVLSRDQSDEETIRRFRNEAQSAARLDHPNIARVYYVGEDQGVNFIVFEFIEGANLRDEIQSRGPLELEQALYYTLQIAQALDHSSSREVIHRDIKPSNVLITAAGQVKLVDMGLARMHQVEPSANDLTASGVMLGTFDYISPEQARDPRAADVRSDLYSLGCTLFYMLTGQPPFPEGTALQKLLQHNTDEPPNLRQFRPELSPRVTAIVAKLLAKKPSQRHQSAAELIADIIHVGEQLGLTRLTDFGGSAAVPSVQPNHWVARAWQVAAAFALLVASVVVMETIASPRQTGEVARRVRFKESDSSSPPELIQPKAPANIPRKTTDAINQAEVPVVAAAASRDGTPDARTQVKADASPAENTLHDLPLANNPAGAADTVRPEASDLAVPPPPAAQEPAEVQKIKRIIVATDSTLQPPESQTEIVSSLAEACSRAAELGITEVELRFSGRRVESPLEIGSSRLTVRAAPGFHPIIVFQPEVRMAEDEMIRLVGGSSTHVGFEGLELRLELPADLPADGWSLLAISTGQSLDLAGCVLTVQDGDSDSPPIHGQVAMISVNRRRAGDTMTMADSQVAMGQQARINLDRCIARGEASLVCLTDETPLTVRWNQGLLVTPHHFLETGGSASEPQYYDQIVLDLDNVTAVCRGGLYHLHRGPGKAYQFHVSAYPNQCIFVGDAGAPLFEMVGLTAPPEEDELQSTGEGNRFSPADMPFLFVRSTTGSEPQVFKLGRRWSSETRSQAGVPWLHAPRLDQPAHDALKRDFVTDAEPDDGRAGFDPLVLPEASQTQ